MSARPYQEERRHAPRVAKALPFAVAHGVGEFVTKTKNLSASGAYCTLRRFLPPMTKLHVRLEVPANPHARQIACQGVVVRVEPPRHQPRQRRYHMAIVFQDLADRDRAAIARFVQLHLPQT